jgi:hypothetical protein
LDKWNKKSETYESLKDSKECQQLKSKSQVALERTDMTEDNLPTSSQSLAASENFFPEVDGEHAVEVVPP